MKRRRRINKRRVTILLIIIMLVIFGIIFSVKSSQSSLPTSANVSESKKEEKVNTIENTTKVDSEISKTEKQENAQQSVEKQSSVEQNTVVQNTNTQTVSVQNNETQNTEVKSTEITNTNSQDTENIKKVEENKVNTTTETKTAATEGEKGVVYLTFDDGPSADITPKILDILSQENVKATFFILNYDSNKEHLVKREHDEGHAIGIHGWSHVYSEIYQTEETYISNLDKLQEKIKNSIGITTKITRFPGGSSNTISKKYNAQNGLMSRLVKLVQEKGYEYYDWNVDSNDAGSAKNQTQVYNNVIKGLSKKRPNVVLMHDKGGNTKTLNALRDIINYCKQNGYEMRPITYNGGMVSHHNVNN